MAEKTGLLYKLNFWASRVSRMGYFNLRYRLHKWKLIHGIYFPVDLHFGYSVLRFIDNGEYETGEIEIIKATLEEGDTVLELGTGLGFISAYCAKKIGSSNVHTFEANPFLEKNISALHNKNKVSPSVHFAILGESDGEVPFYVDKKSFLRSSLFNPGNDPDKVAVTIVRSSLNKVISEIKPTYLIMDIEGGEAEIMRIIDFQTIRKIQFELHPDVIGSENVNTIFSRLAESGFKPDPSLNTHANNFFFSK